MARNPVGISWNVRKSMQSVHFSLFLTETTETAFGLPGPLRLGATQLSSSTNPATPPHHLATALHYTTNTLITSLPQKLLAF